MTLRRLLMWSYDPLLRLKFLAALVDACKGLYSLSIFLFYELSVCLSQSLSFSLSLSLSLN